MKSMIGLLVMGLLTLPLAGTVRAQAKEIPGDTVTVSGTIEAIDNASRAVTLKGPQGNYVTVDVPRESQRFSELKVGDKVTVKYYDNVVVRLKAPGEKAVDTEHEAVTPGSGAKPGGTAATQRTMTATIEAIDPKVPSVTFKGPSGWKYSRRILDKSVLDKIKVGDQVDFTWTEAVTISVESPRK